MPNTMPKSTRDIDDDLDSSVAKRSRILRGMRDHGNARYGDMVLDSLGWRDSDSGSPRIEWTSHVPIETGTTPVKRGDPLEDDVYKYVDNFKYYHIKHNHGSPEREAYLARLIAEEKEKKRLKEQENWEKQKARNAKKRAEKLAAQEDQKRVWAEERQLFFQEQQARELEENRQKKIQRQKDQHAFIDTRRRVVMKQFKISELEARVYIAICRDCFMWRGKPCPHCYREDYYSGGTAEYAILVRCRCQTPQVLHVDWRSIWDTAKQYPEEFGQWARDYVAPL